jgi:hypothetical protein
MSIIEAIVDLYHRLIGATKADVTLLEERLSKRLEERLLDLTLLENRVVNKAEQLFDNAHSRIDAQDESFEKRHAALQGELTAELTDLRATTKRKLRVLEANVIYNYSLISDELQEHLVVLKHLDMSKRESPNVQGTKPTLLQ